METDFNPYEILGVPSTATPEEIKTAYRRLAKRLHPDTNGLHEGAAKQFQDITAAHEILSDSVRRGRYDRSTRDTTLDKYFRMKVVTSKSKLMQLGEEQVIYFLVNIDPDPRAAETKSRKQTNLNLTLVLDHSNSMNGVRLEKVKVAANQIVDSLSENDIISVVAFNDRAHVVIPATNVEDKPGLKAKIGLMSAAGGTEIFQGLQLGYEQNETYQSPDYINHMILLTDGRTYGDQNECLELAQTAAKAGVSISAMGLGSDWNDEFLDQIASKTGGVSQYISSAGEVGRFFNQHIKNLANTFAERMRLSIAPDTDIRFDMGFKLSPQSQPLNELVDGAIPLGNLQISLGISVLLQFTLPAELELGQRSLVRFVTTGDIMMNKNRRHYQVADMPIEITEDDYIDDPPMEILNALSKLTLYRLQQRANHALADGNIEEATRRLENLATRLLEMGQDKLAHQTLSEARRVAYTKGLSDRGKKTIKYQTRMLVSGENNT